MIQIRLVLTLVTFAFIFTSCSTVGHSQRFTDKTWGNPAAFLTEMGGSSQTLSDSELQILIENTLLYNPNQGEQRPQVSVHNQVVTLTGDVSSLRAKRSTEDLVQSIHYVKRVNNLTHALSTGSRHDPQFSKDAQLALALNSNLVGNNIEVFVQNGIIYLTGRVQNLSQKELASHIVALGRGSFVIKNQIRVASFADS
jgi:osmotically-inducible protein OsmY